MASAPGRVRFLKRSHVVNASQRASRPSKLPFCLVAVAAFAFLAGCTPKRIPGTEIDDTDETRAIISVLDTYRRAMEAKDAEKVLSLVSEGFIDNAGTGTPNDDLDYMRLRDLLPKRLAKVEDFRLEITVKKITLAKDQESAEAIYYYTETFRLPGYTNKPLTEAGLKMMSLKKVGGDWKMVSGI